jgi:prophage DNA circulation protein
MFKIDAKEAAELSERTLKLMLAVSPTKGRAGADLRTAIGDFIAHAETLFYNDEAGQPLDEIFELARLVGITQAQLADVRTTTGEEKPATVGGALIKNALIHFSLATEGRIIASMAFRSRNDVDKLKNQMNVIFAAMEEIAADDMAQMTYQALINLHAAVTFYLIEMARPLPRMVRYRFNSSQPTLVTAYKLYADAARGDQLRAENKTIHPAFLQMAGVALSK